MKLTMELSDQSITTLLDCLRISKAQFDLCGGTSYRSLLKGESELAYRILQARHALGLSNSTEDCCHDFGKETLA